MDSLPTTTPVSHLLSIGACNEARSWVKEGKFRSLETAWLNCDNIRWLLWYTGRKAGPVGDPKRKVIVLVACEIARLVLPIWNKRYPDDKRVETCIATAEEWTRGEATIEKVLEARRASCADASCAAAAAACAAAFAAAYAAVAVDGNDAASYAACAAAYAYAAEHNQVMGLALAIVRKHYPTLPK